MPNFVAREEWEVGGSSAPVISLLLIASPFALISFSGVAPYGSGCFRTICISVGASWNLAVTTQVRLKCTCALIIDTLMYYFVVVSIVYCNSMSSVFQAPSNGALTTVTCTSVGQTLSVAGYSGSLTCPDPAVVCAERQLYSTLAG